MNIPVFSFALREDIKDDKRFLPTKGEPKASGWDVRACMQNHKSLIVRPGEYAKVPLGFRCNAPDGWWYELKPRSSTFAKKLCHALYGTIDETYEHELVFAFQYSPTDLSVFNILEISFGEAIGQIIPVKRQEMIVKPVSNADIDKMYAERNSVRNGGFGSTDSK